MGDAGLSLGRPQQEETGIDTHGAAQLCPQSPGLRGQGLVQCAPSVCPGKVS